MNLRIGVNPLLWTNDDLPSLGASTPLETCLHEAATAGYSGIELGNKFPRQTDELGPLLERHALHLVSGWFSGGLLMHSVEEEIQAVQAHLSLLRSLGSTVMVYCDTTACIHGRQDRALSGRPVLHDDDWKSFGKKLTEFGDYCADEGVAISYHHHMGTAVQSATDIDRLMEHSGDSVGLLLDSGHLVYAGGDPLSVARNHGSRINHVHCKNVRADVLRDAHNRDRSFLDAVLDGVFTVPGDDQGSIDYRALLTELKKIRIRRLAGGGGRAGSGQRAIIAVRSHGCGLPDQSV